MVVVLPAPLRPTRPMRSPGWTRRAGPSASSSVRAPARTSRSVAVITRRTSLIVGKDRGAPLGTRGDRFFEVSGEQAHIELPEALGLHMPSRVPASSPVHSVRLVSSTPGRENAAICEAIS